MAWGGVEMRRDGSPWAAQTVHRKKAILGGEGVVDSVAFGGFV